MADQDYSNHQLVAFLESIGQYCSLLGLMNSAWMLNLVAPTGAAFGACQNAMTSADETIYEVSIPTDQPEFLKQSFAILASWCCKIRSDCVARYLRLSLAARQTSLACLETVDTSWAQVCSGGPEQGARRSHGGVERIQGLHGAHAGGDLQVPARRLPGSRPASGCLLHRQQAACCPQLCSQQLHLPALFSWMLRGSLLSLHLRLGLCAAHQLQPWHHVPLLNCA